MSYKSKIKEAVTLRGDSQPEKALEILLALKLEAANDADWNYQVAWTYDRLGQEGAAVPYYECALANGLQEDRAGAYLGLGSTYRCLGEYEKSAAVFEKACAEFPNDRALKVFYALTLFNLNRADACTDILLTQLLDTTDDNEIKKYDRALRFYKDKLNQKWQ